MHCFLERLVARQLAHTNAFGLVERHAQRHFFFFKAQHIKLKLHPCDFGILELDYATNPMLGIHHIIAYIKHRRVGRHITTFLIIRENKLADDIMSSIRQLAFVPYVIVRSIPY